MSIYVLNGLCLAPMWPLLTSVLSELLNCIIKCGFNNPRAHSMPQSNNQEKLLLCVNICIFAYAFLHGLGGAEYC